MAEYYAKPVAYPDPPPQPDGRVEPRPAGMPEHAHEGTDVGIRPLVITGVVLVVFLIGTCIFLALLFRFYDAWEVRGTRPTSALQDSVSVPVPNPRLQGSPDRGFNTQVPAKDMEDFRAVNEKAMTTYSPAKNGIARIPVTDKKTGRGGRGIDLALERKLFPTAPAATTQPATRPAAGGGGGAQGQRETGRAAQSKPGPEAEQQPEQQQRQGQQGQPQPGTQQEPKPEAEGEQRPAPAGQSGRDAAAEEPTAPRPQGE